MDAIQRVCNKNPKEKGRNNGQNKVLVGDGHWTGQTYSWTKSGQAVNQDEKPSVNQDVEPKVKSQA